MRVDVDPRPRLDRAAQRLPVPRRLEPVHADGTRHGGDELLAARGDVLVVRVRLVPLEHGELGVVLEGDALVAEVLADLVDALQATHDQPLEIQLGGDPQVQRAVELVVVGRERPAHPAAVDRLQDRRLDLDEARGVQEPPDLRDDARARDEQLARLLVRHQVELALAVAGLDVGQPVVLLGRRQQRLREQRPVVDLQRQLAAAGPEDRAIGADQVAEIEPHQPVQRVLPEHVRAGVQLHAPRAVDEVDEGRLALPAARGDPARDPRADVGLLTRLEPLVRRLDLSDRHHARVGVRERLNTLVAQRGELAPALLD